MAVCLMAVPAIASTGEATYPNEFVNSINELDHVHELPEVDKFQQGVGVDLVTYANDTIELGTEVRYNFSTEITTAMSVLKIKKSLFSLIFKK